MRDLVTIVREQVARALERAAHVVRRGTLSAATSAGYQMQVEGYDGEVFDGVESWQHFGFASRGPSGGEACLVLPGGAGEGAVAVAETDRAHRPALAEGDACLYGKKTTGQATVKTLATGVAKVEAGGATPGNVELPTSGAVVLTPGGASKALVGGAAAVEPVIKGTTYNTAENTVQLAYATYLNLLGAALTALAGDAFMAALQPATLAALNAAGTPGSNPATAAIAAFLAVQPTWLATKANVL